MKTSESNQVPRPSPARFRSAGVRLIAICAPLAVGGLFLYAGGWFTPGALTPAAMINTFERVNGVHSGFRRNHAKGVCVSGYFESNGQGQVLSRALVFRPGRLPIVGRFALAGGEPFAADTHRNVRSLAILFLQPDGQEWRAAMINIPLFVVNTPEAFAQFLVASSPDRATGRVNSEAMDGFLANHPETAAALKVIGSHPFSAGFADSPYYALNAFFFINDRGESAPVRWSLTPDQAIDGQSQSDGDKNYLFDALIQQIHAKPLRWHLILTVGHPGDPTAEAASPWPSDRKQIDAGFLTIEGIESEDTSPTRDINFDPLVLPDGIAPSDDPLLSARSAAYSQSFRRRESERKEPSAISTEEVKK